MCSDYTLLRIKPLLHVQKDTQTFKKNKTWGYRHLNIFLSSNRTCFYITISQI